MKLFSKSEKEQYFRGRKAREEFYSWTDEYIQAQDDLTGVEIELHCLIRGRTNLVGIEEEYNNIMHRIIICKINLKHVKKYK